MLNPTPKNKPNPSAALVSALGNVKRAGTPGSMVPGTKAGVSTGQQKTPTGLTAGRRVSPTTRTDGKPVGQAKLSPLQQIQQRQSSPTTRTDGTPKLPKQKRPVGKKTPGINPNAPKPPRRQFPKVNIY